jgi:hypothetical protein
MRALVLDTSAPAHVQARREARVLPERGIALACTARGEKALKQPGHKKGTPFEDGPLIGKAADLGSFVSWPENSDLLRKLNKRLKLFRGEDGWFASGAQGQLWEWGRGKLGFTVGTAQMISRAIETGFVPTQRGDGEANFSCPWTEENVAKLTKLLCLRIRRPASVPANPFRPSNPFRNRSPEHQNDENSDLSGGIRPRGGSDTRKAEIGL